MHGVESTCHQRDEGESRDRCSRNGCDVDVEIEREMQPRGSLILLLKLNHLLHPQQMQASLMFVAIKFLHKKVSSILYSRDMQSS